MNRFKKTNDKPGFRINTMVGLIFLFLIGGGLYFVSYKWLGDNTTAREVTIFGGQTLIGAAVVSLLMEMHSVQDNYQKVRDFLLLEEPSFIERYDMQEVDRIIELAIKQKICLYSKKPFSNKLFAQMIDEQKFFLKSYIEYTASLLGEKGFYCSYHRRQININPKLNDHYNINITVEVELQNLTEVRISESQIYRFYFISEKQVTSFRINSLDIDLEKKDLSKLELNKNKDKNPSTSRHPFNDWVEFKVPFTIEPMGQLHYILNYEYDNFEQSCYITYSLPYITRSFQETYSLIGDNAQQYKIHASAYTPYKKQIDSRNLVQRLNDVTLSVNSNKWIVPGSGFVAVVRRKIENAEENE